MPLITFKPELQILALDPARLTGVAHSSGRVATWDIGSGNERLSRLRDFILDSARAWGCKLLAAEYASFGSKHVRTQAMHNEQLGIIRQCAAELGVDVVTYAPTSIKKFATGHGKAEKAQVMRACETWLGIKPADDNQSDACFVLLMAQQGYVTNTARKSKPRVPRSMKAKRAAGWLF